MLRQFWIWFEIVHKGFTVIKDYRGEKLKLHITIPAGESLIKCFNPTGDPINFGIGLESKSTLFEDKIF